MSIEAILSDILRREGGFVHHPSDRGGATNMGITQKTLAQWRGRAVSVDEVRRLSEREARAIYSSEYVHRPALDKLPGPLQPILIDAAVHHGPKTAARFLQQVLNAICADTLAEDGLIGPITVQSAREQTDRLGHILIGSIIEERRRFYLKLTDQEPSQAVFLKGWLNRINEFEHQST